MSAEEETPAFLLDDEEEHVPNHAPAASGPSPTVDPSSQQNEEPPSHQEQQQRDPNENSGTDKESSPSSSSSSSDDNGDDEFGNDNYDDDVYESPSPQREKEDESQPQKGTEEGKPNMDHTDTSRTQSQSSPRSRSSTPDDATSVSSRSTKDGDHDDEYGNDEYEDGSEDESDAPDGAVDPELRDPVSPSSKKTHQQKPQPLRNDDARGPRTRTAVPKHPLLRPAIRLGRAKEIKSMRRPGAEEDIIRTQKSFFKAAGMASPLLAFYGERRTVPKDEKRRRPSTSLGGTATHLGPSSPTSAARSPRGPRSDATPDGSRSQSTPLTLVKLKSRDTAPSDSPLVSPRRRKLTAAEEFEPTSLQAMPIHGGGLIKPKPIVSPIIREHEKHLLRVLQKDPVAYFKEVGTRASNKPSKRMEQDIEKRKDRPTNPYSNFAGTASRQRTYTSLGPGPAYGLPSQCFDPKIGTHKMGPKPMGSSAATLGRKITPSALDYAVETKWNYSSRRSMPNQLFTKTARWREEKPSCVAEVSMSKRGESAFRRRMIERGLTPQGQMRSTPSPSPSLSASSKPCTNQDNYAGPATLRDWNDG